MGYLKVSTQLFKVCMNVLQTSFSRALQKIASLLSLGYSSISAWILRSKSGVFSREKRLFEPMIISPAFILVELTSRGLELMVMFHFLRILDVDSFYCMKSMSSLDLVILWLGFGLMILLRSFWSWKLLLISGDWPVRTHNSGIRQISVRVSLVTLFLSLMWIRIGWLAVDNFLLYFFS